MLLDLQTRFRGALLDPQASLPPDIVSHTSDMPVRRFAVYRNNVVMSLIEALANRFPAAVAMVGDEFFRGMARLFVRAAPPRSPLLLMYGDDLPAFVEQFEPA